jgi:hypothetical protein
MPARGKRCIFEGQGPNLRLAAERLRYDHLQRWMHFPQRFAPATIMSRYTKDRDHAIADTPFEGNGAHLPIVGGGRAPKMPRLKIEN